MSKVQKHLSNGEWLDCGAQPGNCPIKGEDGETVEHMSADSPMEMQQKVESDLAQRHGTFGTVSKPADKGVQTVQNMSVDELTDKYDDFADRYDYGGFGYLNERNNKIANIMEAGSGDFAKLNEPIERADQQLLEHAQQNNWNEEKLFAFTNSIDGRKYGDEHFGNNGRHAPKLLASFEKHYAAEQEEIRQEVIADEAAEAADRERRKNSPPAADIDPMEVHEVFEEFAERDDYAGRGYLDARRDKVEEVMTAGSGDFETLAEPIDRADTQLLEAADKYNWSEEELFDFTNSRNGRKYADEHFGNNGKHAGGHIDGFHYQYIVHRRMED